MRQFAGLEEKTEEEVNTLTAEILAADDAGKDLKGKASFMQVMQAGEDEAEFTKSGKTGRHDQGKRAGLGAVFRRSGLEKQVWSAVGHFLHSNHVVGRQKGHGGGHQRPRRSRDKSRQATCRVIAIRFSPAKPVILERKMDFEQKEAKISKQETYGEIAGGIPSPLG